MIEIMEIVAIQNEKVYPGVQTVRLWLSVICSRPNLKVWIPKNTKTYASALISIATRFSR